MGTETTSIFEEIAAQAIAHNAEVDKRKQQERAVEEHKGENIGLFEPTPPELADTGESKIDTPEKAPSPNSPKELGFESGKAAPGELVTPTEVSQQQWCPTGWDDCVEIVEPWGTIQHPGDVIGVFRLDLGQDYPVTRAWTAAGEPIALYDGRSVFAFDDLNMKQPEDGFVLADVPGLAWLRGQLPDKPIELPVGSVLAQLGVKHYPFSGIRNVLLAQGVKGLLAGMRWSHQLEQLQKFGGMPVIAFPEGNPRALASVNWRGATIRASDKTWEAVTSKIGAGKIPRKGLK